MPWLYAPSTYGYVTRDRASAFPGRFTTARRFHEGRAAVGDADGKSGFIDGAGATVVPLRYDLVGDFRDGRARVFLFRKPILGPVEGLVLRAGELTEKTIDRDGHELGEKKTAANVLPDLASVEAPLFEEHAPRPMSPPPRWETFAGEKGHLGLRELATKREVFPARYGDFRLIEDVDGSGVKFLAARGPNDSPPPGPTWSVHDRDAKELHAAAFDVGAFSSEGCFTVATLTGGGEGDIHDATGHRVVDVPFAAGPFVFRDGIAEVFVADVAPMFVGHDGKLYADLGPIDERHRAVGRRTMPFPSDAAR